MPEGLWKNVSALLSAASQALSKLVPYLPTLLFYFSLILLSSLYTFIAVRENWFPAPFFETARKTASTYATQLQSSSQLSERFAKMSATPLRDIERARIRSRPAAANFSEHFLLTGDAYEYLRACPQHGCLAVEFDRQGRLIHAYPFRPDEFASKQTVSLPYETALFDYSKDVRINGLARLPNGDLIVIFHQAGTFPFGGGVGRIDRAGHVIWFRHDYSHHWPTMLNAGEIAVPSQRIEKGPIDDATSSHLSISNSCQERFGADTVRILRLDGTVVQEIPVLDALLASPYRAFLYDTKEPCDPTHLNYVQAVTPAIARVVDGAKPGDLLVSLRNISTIAVIRRSDGKLLQAFRGTFVHQHAVTPLVNSTEVLIFDNWGADRVTGPSRLLLYDLATGHERTLFPTKSMPPDAIFSSANGQIDVSADGSRILVAASKAGIGYEINLADRSILTEFDNLHDVSGISIFPESRKSKAARFQLTGIYYVP
ncbi:MAG: hypothetical protein HY243_11570 [Proteobacteria bacterium]|nr:hypothetical protein [Pseudomonadota bacterium]